MIWIELLCETIPTQEQSKNCRISFQNVSKLMLSKLPKSKNTLENVGPEANREKTTMKLKHINLEAILEPFWRHLSHVEVFWGS